MIQALVITILSITSLVTIHLLYKNRNEIADTHLHYQNMIKDIINDRDARLDYWENGQPAADNHIFIGDEVEYNKTHYGKCHGIVLRGPSASNNYTILTSGHKILYLPGSKMRKTGVTYMHLRKMFRVWDKERGILVN